MRDQQRAYILCWIQDHPNKCHNTNLVKMGKEMETSRIKDTSCTHQLRGMLHEGLILRSGSSWKARYIINYDNPKLPKEIHNRASPIDREGAKLAKKNHEFKATPPKKYPTRKTKTQQNKPKVTAPTQVAVDPPKPKTTTIDLPAGSTIIININIK